MIGAGCGKRPHILSDLNAVHDIATLEDCEQLVRAFYGQALNDPVIGWLFTDIAHLNLEAHVPKIASFWETVLLGAHSYRGGAFAPHAALHMKAPLRRGHFERWLWLWHQTVDELFAGERAVCGRAGRVGQKPRRPGGERLPRQAGGDVSGAGSAQRWACRHPARVTTAAKLCRAGHGDDSRRTSRGPGA